MRLLLDTHAFVWANQSASRLGRHVDLVRDLDNDLLISAVVAWELAIKTALGRLVLPEPVAAYVPSRVVTLAATPLAIEHEHALAVASLPLHHRDPFDRLLIAQSMVLGVPILTADPAIAAYDVDVLLIDDAAR